MPFSGNTPWYLPILTNCKINPLTMSLMVGTVALWSDTTMKLPPLIRTFDFNCDLRRIGFLWPLGVDVAQREYFSKLPWIMLFLHNRCNFSDAFSAIVSFSQIFRLFRGWNGGIWNQRSIISVCTISYNCSTSEGVVLTKLQMLH